VGSAPARRLVLASGNPGKLRELETLLGPGWQILSQAELGISPAEETGDSFAANALLKARHAARLSGLPALADDSGIEVDALGGRPGVHSARYAGPEATDEDNNRLLLRELADVPDARRTARYRCVLAFVATADDPAPLLVEGTWEGLIGFEPRGRGGFGYDPLFIDAASGRTGAELTPAEKNARSHRGQALARLKPLLLQQFAR
jgi:XTP/dITP diphosphohydrolase